MEVAFEQWTQRAMALVDFTGALTVTREAVSEQFPYWQSAGAFPEVRWYHGCIFALS